MPQIRLTEKTIAKLKAPDPSGNQMLYWDTDLRGFGVRASGKTSDKSYIIQRAINGNTRRVTIGPTNVLTLAEARNRAQGYLGDFARGVDPKAKKAASATLGSVLDDYLSARKDLRPRTRESYRAAVEGHLKNWVDRPLTSITRDMVERHHVAIANEVVAREKEQAYRDATRWEQRAKGAEKRGWMDAAANHRQRAAMAKKRETNSGHVAANNAVKVLRVLWNHAADREPDIGANPVRLKKLWYPVKPRTGHLASDDLPAFYKAVMELQSAVGRDYLLLVLFTGLRRREAEDLRWADVDLKARTLRVPQTKSGRPLDLPLSDFVHAMLIARRALGDTEFVFPAASKSGHIAEPKFFLAQVAKATGRRISVHDLRRTFVTHAESCDISPHALRALVNHSLGKDVHSGYIQMNVERLREPAQRVTDKMKSMCGVKEPAGKNVAKLKRKG